MIRKFLSRRTLEDDYEKVEEYAEDEYVQLDTDMDKHSNQKVIIRPYNLDDFSAVKKIIDLLREGETVLLVNIKPLREKDIVELKRAINKLKKTCEAVSGDIAGFGDDYIIVAPSFAEIYKATESAEALE